MTGGATLSPSHALATALRASPTGRLEAFEQLTLPELFAAQCEIKPDALAVSTRAGSLTYAELDAISQRWALRLKRAGLGSGDRVLVCVERGLELPAMLLGVLRAGACYVPIDPGFPQERVTMIAADARPRAAILSNATQGLIPEEGLIVLRDGAQEPVSAESSEVADQAVTPPKTDDLAYLIFTSGSTGRPKGVPITHGALLNFLLAMSRRPGIGAGDRVLALTTVSFDISVLELFLPLIAGASTFIASSDDALNPARLAEFIADNRLTLLQATPATWQLLVEYGWRPVPEQVILCGGEAFPLALAKTLHEHAAAVWNMYGPTEATVWSSCHRVEDADLRRGRISLGDAVPGLKYRIAPLEVPATREVGNRRGVRSGELWIAGVGVTPGYFGRPELDQERFVEQAEAGRTQRFYRTGDLVETDAEGRLFYIDRLDNQVKLRGFRIELGEIETVLAQLPAVQECAVVMAQPEPGENVLVGCIRLHEHCSDSRLEAHLRNRLPEYMVPHMWVRLERLPQTPNRKIDRKALRSIVEEEQGRGGVPGTFEAPFQQALAELWSELLGRGPERESDDFLALGGHSLLAARLSVMIESRLNRKVKPVDLLTGSTLKQHADTVAAGIKTTDAQHPPALMPLPSRLDLSSAQRRMWFTGELLGDHRIYHESEAYRIRGALDLERLRRAVARIVERHIALQLHLRMGDDRPEWTLPPDVRPHIRIQELEGPEAVQGPDLARRMSEEASRAFTFANEPLIRFCVFTDGASEHVLQSTAHHMIIDGLSQTRIWQEIAQEYSGSRSARPLPKGAVDSRFVQYLLQHDDYAPEELAFWRSEFAAPAPSLELVTDKPRPGRFDFTAYQVTLGCGPEMLAKVQETARSLRTTPYILLLSCYAAFLERYAQQGEYVIGTPVSGRGADVESDAVGLFINTLPLRIPMTQQEPLEALVDRVRSLALRAFAHEQVPFDQIVAAVNPQRELSRTPLYQTLFAINDLRDRPRALSPEAAWQMETVDVGYAPAELVLFAELCPGELQLRLQGSRQLFEKQSLQRMLEHFRTFLDRALENPGQAHDSVPMVGADERSLLSQWNQTAADYPRDKAIHTCFQEQVERAPETTALERGDTRISYAALSRFAARVAADLTAADVGPGQRVGLAAGRSVESVAAMLAILEVGAVYVPLDLGYPPDRLKIMIETGAVGHVLVAAKDQAIVDEIDTRIPAITLRDYEDIEGPLLKGTAVGAQSPAYIMFTSGSTGTPKGIEVSHHNVLRLVKNTNYVELNADTRFLMYAPISFDASNLEIWGPLLNGGSLVVPEVASPTGQDIQRILQHHRVNSVWLTTALFHHMAEHHAEAFANARYLLTGGEMLSAKWARHVLEVNPGLILINFYGPTENTTFSSFYPMYSATDVIEPVPIGRPITNSTLHVVDQAGQPCPISVPGELWVGGEGVALGYVGQPELTERVFLPDPFSAEAGARVYRTGDRVRWRSDGNLEFLGRLDSQVKIRGYRIEPDEVTAALESLPGITHAVTVPWTAPSGERQLISYITSEEQAQDTAGLQTALAKVLPRYMLPAHIMTLEVMPIGPAGKVDRKALPDPGLAAVQDDAAGGTPSTPTERALAKIWKDVLGLERVGPRDNFFALGGSSIKALAVFTRIEQDLGLDVPLSVLLAKPTLVELAGALDALSTVPVEAKAEQPSPQAWQSLVVLEPRGNLQPVVCIHAVGGNVLSYRGLMNVAGPNRPILGFQSQGLDGLRAPQRSIRQMAEDYVAELLMSDYRGPYILLGGSMGGTIALEMAAILQARGEKVDWVILLDSVGPEGRVIPPEKPSIQFRERFWKSLRARTEYYLKSTLTWSYRQFHLRLPYWLRPFFIEKQHKVVLANHREKPYWGNVLLLRGPERFKGVYSDPHLGWNGTLKGQMIIEEVDAPHADFLESLQTQSRLKAFFEEQTWTFYDAGEDYPGQTNDG